MKSMKAVAFLAFLLNTILFATYYAIAKEALERIDPVMFTFFELTTLAPVGLCILILTWDTIRWSIVKQGVLLGSSLCLALFTIAIALKYTTATGTAFFPALNGFLAALIAWIFLRQPVRKATWCAGLLSTVGVALLIMNSSMGGTRGVLIAFLGGLFFTGYVFLSDNSHDSHERSEQQAHWPLFGIELLTMAVWACLVALLFGDWESIHMALPKDGLVILYVAGACTFLPTLITVLMQKHISPVTVSFIYILEPVFSAIIAMLYLHEMLSLNGYIGGVLVVAGALIHTCGIAWKTRHAQHTQHTQRPYAQPIGSRAAETQKLLGVRLSPAVGQRSARASVGAGVVAGAGWGPSGSPVFRVTESLAERFPATPRATQRVPSPPHHHSRPYKDEEVRNRRGVYSIGAVEWVDEDICEQPTRPELSPASSSSASERAIWTGADVYSHPTEPLSIVRQRRVRITDELKEMPAMSLPMKSTVGTTVLTPTSPTHSHEAGESHPKTGIRNVAATAQGKGPVWSEEDADMFLQNRKEVPVKLVEFAD